MGSVIDYFKPIEGKTYCEMLQGKEFHQWSSDGKNWVTPLYHMETKHNHGDYLGGSTAGWPKDGRKHLSFWGGNGNSGGCCHNSLSDSSSWGRAFNIFYGIGKMLSLKLESINLYQNTLLLSKQFRRIRFVR